MKIIALQVSYESIKKNNDGIIDFLGAVDEPAFYRERKNFNDA
jgi:hypothetical protein